MSNKPVVEKLKILLADTYALYLKTQNYHWNVTGINFKPLHEMFENQYNDLANAIDEIAEKIRILGEKAPATFASYSKITNIKDGNENASAIDMVKELADDQRIIIKTLNDVLEVAENANDEGTLDLATNRIVVHEKAAWMLNATAS